MTEMKTVGITVSPYANQYGTLVIPKGLTEEEEKTYVSDHFDEIKFGEADLDYKGVDIEISEGTPCLSEEDTNKLCRLFTDLCFTLWAGDADVTPERIIEEAKRYISNIQSHINAGNGDGMMQEQNDYRDLIAFVSDTKYWDL